MSDTTSSTEVAALFADELHDLITDEWDFTLAGQKYRLAYNDDLLEDEFETPDFEADDNPDLLAQLPKGVFVLIRRSDSARFDLQVAVTPATSGSAA